MVINAHSTPKNLLKKVKFLDKCVDIYIGEITRVSEDQIIRSGGACSPAYKGKKEMAKSLPNFNLEEYESRIRDVAAISSSAGNRSIHISPKANFPKLVEKPGKFVDVLSNMFKTQLIEGKQYGKC